MSGLLGAKGPPSFYLSPHGKAAMVRRNRRKKEKPGFRDTKQGSMTAKQRRDYKAREKAKSQGSEDLFYSQVGEAYKGG